MDPFVCKERILSENYRDFIISDTIPFTLSDISPEQLCAQNADFGYRCIYISSLLADPVNLSRFSYNTIPKCYTLLSLETLTQSGISQVQNFPTLQLKGNGILLGFIDTGIDYTNPVFQNIDGSTRILGIWDQTIQDGPSPSGFIYGTEYTQEEINLALTHSDPFSVVPSIDEQSHGTFLAGVAAGSGDVEEQFLGAAPEASIAMVKLKPAKQYLKNYYYIPEDTPCYQETDILLGLKYLNNLASKFNLPLVICVALGSNMGGHTSLSAFSYSLENYSLLNSRIPVVGCGNEADQRHHYSYELKKDTPNSVEIRVGENIKGFVMELWSDLPNLLAINLTSPSGDTSNPIPIETSVASTYQFILDGTKVEITYRLIIERSSSAMVYFRFQTPAAGIWRLTVTPLQAITGFFHLWLPVREFIGGEIYFLNANPDYTVTDPANTIGPISVSYYDSATDGIALSSSRGYTRNQLIVPDITAPGINVKGPLPNNRYAIRSGSSVSAALTSGASALLLEWARYQMGISRIDSYELKSLLILGAIRSPAMIYPNQLFGYGRLNLFNTFNEIRNL